MIASLSIGLPQTASALPGTLLADATSGDSATLAAGQQLLIEGQDGDLAFAGRKLALRGFTGILGYASEVAYVIVIDGRVADGTIDAERGSMLMIPPYGAAPVVQRYDAARLAASWSVPAKGARADAFAALQDVADGQKMGLRLGRLGRTRLNIAAPGGRDGELARRSVKGEGAVQAIRFSGQGDVAAIEAQVVERFLAALSAGDVDGVAGLMDPVPFGNVDLRGGAAEARRMMARALVEQRDWEAALSGVTPVREGRGNVWKLGGTGVLVLRPMGDFVFVRAIEMGGQS
ncbi:MAG: hypothetical protein ABW039_11550 [Sphingobium sp.]